MNRLRRLLACVAMFACFFSMIHVPKALGDETISTNMDFVTTINKKVVLIVPVGNDTGEIGYLGDCVDTIMGPQDFRVEEGKVYILDSVNERVLTFEGGKYVGVLSLNGAGYCDTMYYDGSCWAVANNIDGVTGIYDVTGSLVRQLEHPKEVDSSVVYRINAVQNDEIIWETYSDEVYSFNYSKNNLQKVEQTDLQKITNTYSEDELTSVQRGNQKWTVDDKNKLITVLGTYGNALFYEQYEYVPNVDVFLAEYSVHKLNADGSESYAIFDTNSWYAHPLTKLYVANDGKVYLMECFENNVVISEVLFNTTDVSKMDELKESVKHRSLALESERNVTRLALSRDTVLNRAENMRLLTWTVRAAHKNNQGNANIVIPSYVTSASDGSTVTGIPYCWGGFNGISSNGTSYKKMRFADVVLGDYTAGNTSSANGSFADGTIGLDCSGYVSSAYGFTTKYGTSGLSGWGNPKNDIESLSLMDYMVKTGDRSHTVLFFSLSNGTVVVYEANGGYGKVIRRSVSASQYNNEGYRFRTAWCVSCRMMNARMVSVDLHQYYCSLCGANGEVEEHNMVNGTCSVCGY